MSGTGGVDASIPMQAGRGTTQPENPLQALGNVANTANALNQLKLFPGQQQLQQGQIALQRQGIQSGAGNLAQQWYQQASNGVLPLLQKWSADPTQAKMSDLTAVMGGMEAGGTGTQPFMSRFLSLGTPANGVDLYNQLRTIAVPGSQTDAGAALGTVVGQPHEINQGGSIQPGVITGAASAGYGSFTKQGAPVPLGLTPGEASQPVQIGIVPPGQPNAGAPIMAPLGASPFANGGRIVPPAGLRNPNGPAVPGAASGGVVTGLGTAQSSGLGAQGLTSNAAFQHISDQGVQARSQAAILDTMLGDTGQFVSGPGQEGINQFRKVAQRISPSVAAAFGVDPASVAANESFDKFANQLADAQGAGSDARLAVNQGANPSSHLSPAGVDLIIRQLRGNADYLQAQGRLAANYPDQTNVRKFQTDLGDNLDPRVFQYARMTPEQKMAFYRSMPNKAEFQKSYYWSQAHNLLPPPVPVAAPAAPVSAVTPSTPTNE